MKTRIIIICMLLGCLNMAAQSQRKIREYKQKVEDAKEMKYALENRLKEINEQINKIIDRGLLKTDNLENYICGFSSVDEMYKAKNIKGILDKNKEKLGGYYLPYSNLLLMRHSLETIYVRADNDRFIRELPLTNSLYPNHKPTFLDSYEKLKKGIRDYAFVISELVRVFDMIDSSEPLSDEDRKDIDNIPYAKRQLDDYLNKPNKRKDIRAEVEKALEEALR